MSVIERQAVDGHDALLALESTAADSAILAHAETNA
jgi:hypothetical protein